MRILAILALTLFAAAVNAQTRRILIIEETEPPPAPVIVEERIYVRTTAVPAVPFAYVYAAAPVYYRAGYAIDRTHYTASGVKAYSSGPLGIRQTVTYGDGTTVEYGLFGRVRRVIRP